MRSPEFSSRHVRGCINALREHRDHVTRIAEQIVAAVLTQERSADPAMPVVISMILFDATIVSSCLTCMHEILALSEGEETQ